MSAWPKGVLLGLLALVGCSNRPPAPAYTGEVRIEKAEVGQSLLKDGLRLVGGKPALLRVYYTADRPELPARLRARVFAAGTYLGELKLEGPAQVPQAARVDELGSTYNATVPAEWVKPGLRVELEADPDNAIGEGVETDNRLTLEPAVGKELAFYLTVVPVVVGGKAPPAYDLETIRKNLLKLWPLTRVDVKERAGYTSQYTDWGQLLGECRRVQVSDNSSRAYYCVGNIGGGIAYVPGRTAFGQPSFRVMTHEVGHNFGLLHAPCGVEGDPNYPYPGAPTQTWGYDRFANALQAPTLKDIMSYCSPNWVSDYHYDKAQGYLEKYPSSPNLRATGQGPSYLVSGRIRDGQVHLDPVFKLGLAPDAPRAGGYRLRLQTAGGAVEAAFEPETVEVPHGSQAAPEQHFTLLLPAPGDLRAVEVLERGEVRLRREAPVRPQAGVPATGAALERTPERLELSWNHRDYPHALLVHVAEDGRRTTLSAGLRGGRAVFARDAVPGGGHLELSLSDGLYSVLEVLR